MNLKLVTVSVMIGVGLIACGKSSTQPEAVTANDFTGAKVSRYMMLVTTEAGKQPVVITSDTLLTPNEAIAKANSTEAKSVTSDASSLDSSTESFWAVTDAECQKNTNSGYQSVVKDDGTVLFESSESTSLRTCQPIMSFVNANVGFLPMAAPFGAAVPWGAAPVPYGQPGGVPYGQPGGVPYGQPGGSPYGQPGGSPYGQPGGSPYGQPGGSQYGQPGGSQYGQGQPGAGVNYYQANNLDMYGYGSQPNGISNSGYGAQNNFNNGTPTSGIDCARQAAFAQQGGKMDPKCYRSNYSYVW